MFWLFRYGTLPKGARIGAYLESLRQSGLTGEPPEGLDIDDDKEDVADAPSKGHSSLLRQAVKNQTEDPRLLKSTNSSNSSGNRKDSGFRTPSPKPRSFRLQSSRSNQQRDNSPAPNLADLEFPPPPPPLDDGVLNDTSSECSSSGRISGCLRQPVTSPRGGLGGTGGGGHRDQLKSSSVNIQLRSSSADGRRFKDPEALELPDQFILGTEMSVEENSLKKNIRKSCESPNTTIESANSGGFVTSKSADSLVSSIPELLQDDPASQPVMSQSMMGILRSPSWTDDNTTSSTPPPEPAPVAAKEENNCTGSLTSLDCLSMNPPSVNLVSELFENLRLKAGKKPGSSNHTQTDADAKLKTSTFNPVSVVVAPPPKPTHPAPAPPKKIDLTQQHQHQQQFPPETSSHDDCDGLPKFDFKSRLRKVNPAGKISGSSPQTNPDATTTAAPVTDAEQLGVGSYSIRQ